MTKYVVLRLCNAYELEIGGGFNPPPGELWERIGESDASSPVADVMARLYREGGDENVDGEYVAVPVRSWKPNFYGDRGPRFGRVKRGG